jgi:hypothetical protein
MPTGFTVVDVFKYAVANLVTKATGATIALLAIATRILVAKGVTVFLLLRLIVALLILVATGVTVAFDDSAQVVNFVTTATGETLELEERFATPIGLLDLEPKADNVTLLLRPTTAAFVLVATGLTVVLLLRLAIAIRVLVATGVIVVLLLKLIVALLILVATGVTVVLLLRLAIAILIVIATRLILALVLSLTTGEYVGVTRALEDIETLPITVLNGGFMVTSAEEPADINPVLVPEEAPNETPRTPNLGPPRRPAIGIAIY